MQRRERTSGGPGRDLHIPRAGSVCYDSRPWSRQAASAALSNPPARQQFDPFTRTTIKSGSDGQGDFYHRAVRMPWPPFLGLMALGFLLLNALFGVLYMLGDRTVEGARAGSFTDHFFFSVQTLATIGYGVMFPRTIYGHVLVTLEAMIGMLGIGIVAALAFARFALPRARVRFSSVAVITDFDGVPTLMLRAANERRNSIIAARVQVSLLRQETTREGLSMRRFYDLKLARAETPMFSLSWLIMHPISADSPFYQMSAQDLENAEFALLVSITGLDETLSQTLHARHSYFNTDIRMQHRFRDMLETSADGSRLLDLRRIDETEPALP
jgi:inward rectifier potassium channel